MGKDPEAFASFFVLWPIMSYTSKKAPRIHDLLFRKCVLYLHFFYCTVPANVVVRGQNGEKRMAESTVRYLITVSFAAASEQKARALHDQVSEFAQQQARMAGLPDVFAHLDEDVLFDGVAGAPGAAAPSGVNESWDQLGFDGVEVD